MKWVPKTSGARWLFVLSLLVLLTPAWLWLADRVALTYPTPETETRFFRSYSPDAAMKPFVIPRYLRQQFDSTGSSAGRGTIANRKNIETTFAVRADDRANLMSAVFDDLLSQLRKDDDVRIVQQSGDAASGFDLKYIAGNTQGTITIGPLEIVDTERVVGHPVTHSGRLVVPPPLCAGELPVSVRVTIEEKWYKSKPPGALNQS